jgi:hypothetical protein
MAEPIPLHRPTTSGGKLSESQIVDLLMDYCDIQFGWRHPRIPDAINADWFGELEKITRKLFDHIGVDWKVCIEIERAIKDVKARARSAALASLRARRNAVPAQAKAASKPAKPKAKAPSKPKVKAKPKAADPTPEPDAATTASVPFLITNAMKARLREIGLTDDEISQLTPAQAHERLNAEPPAG